MQAQEYWALEGLYGNMLPVEAEEAHGLIKEDPKLKPKFECKPEK